jgi:putative flippase GtrA
MASSASDASDAVSANVRWLAPLAAAHPLLRPIARLMPELSYYTLVSAVALAIDLVIFHVLTLGGMRAAVAGVFGYGVGLILHYGLSVRYVFKASCETKTRLRRFAEFVVSGLIGIAITWLIIALATELLHLPPLIGKIAAVGVSFVTVFILRKSIVFADRRAAT